MNKKLIRISSSLLICVLFACTDKAQNQRVYPQTNTVGYQVLKDSCAQCHAAPLPNSRLAKQWPAIVHRMQTHRLKKAYEPIDKVKLQHLISYLQRNARDKP